MYKTIGKCEECQQSPRFLQFVDFSEVGIEQIALCAHGCDDVRSIAPPPKDMVNAALEKERERLKQEEQKVQSIPNQVLKVEKLAAMELRISLCEYTIEQNQDGRMDEEDWGRIIELSKRMEDETRQAIDQCEAIPQSVASMKAWMLLQQQAQFYKELGRYAVGQSM